MRRVKIIKTKVKTEHGTETIHGRISEQSKLRDAFQKETSFWDEKEKDPRKKLKPKILPADHPIAAAYRRYKTDWNNIKPVAATYGYYSFLDVWKLLEDNSKFKGIDDSSFQTYYAGSFLFQGHQAEDQYNLPWHDTDFRRGYAGCYCSMDSPRRRHPSNKLLYL